MMSGNGVRLNGDGQSDCLSMCWVLPVIGFLVINAYCHVITALEQGWVRSFGKAETDDGPSAMYVRGIRAGQVGICRSSDDGTTWQMIGDHTCGIFHQGEPLWADWERFGVDYLALRFNGFALGQPNNK